MKITRSLKGTIFALSMMALSHVQASNEIYIEQVGDNATVTLKQAGSNNTIGSALAPAFIGGGQNVVYVEQSGSSNQLAMLVNGAGTNVTLTITGDSNQQTITCGTSISASCSGSAITHTITTPNAITVSQSGMNTQSATVNASGNNINISIIQSD